MLHVPWRDVMLELASRFPDCFKLLIHGLDIVSFEDVVVPFVAKLSTARIEPFELASIHSAGGSTQFNSRPFPSPSPLGFKLLIHRLDIVSFKDVVVPFVAKLSLARIAHKELASIHIAGFKLLIHGLDIVSFEDVVVPFVAKLSMARIERSELASIHRFKLLIHSLDIVSFEDVVVPFVAKLSMARIECSELASISIAGG
eukprot:gene16110-22252_t